MPHRAGTLTWLRAAVTLGMLPAIAVKVLHHQGWVELFAGWGLPPIGVAVVAAVEAVGVALLWMPRFTLAACLLLGSILSGATVAWLMSGPRLKAALLPFCLLVLVVITARIGARRQRTAAALPGR